MKAIICDISGINLWRRTSTIGGLGPIGSALPQTPDSAPDLARPLRANGIRVAPPASDLVSLLEHYGVGREEGSLHLLVRRPTDRRCLRGVSCHVYGGHVPARSLIPLGPRIPALKGVYVCSPDLLLVQMAFRDISDIEWLRLAMELCGSYRILEDGAHYNCPPVTGSGAVLRRADQLRSAKGSSRARSLAPWVLDNSASAAETDIALALSLPYRLGGSGVGRPELNREIRLSPDARAIFGRESIKPDIMLPARSKLGRPCPCEYESQEFHSTLEQRSYDERRRNTYSALGMSCFSIRSEHLKTDYAFETMVTAIRGVVGRRVRGLPERYGERHARLLGELLSSWRGRREQDAVDWDLVDEEWPS